MRKECWNRPIKPKNGILLPNRFCLLDTKSKDPLALLGLKRCLGNARNVKKSREKYIYEIQIQNQRLQSSFLYWKYFEEMQTRRSTFRGIHVCKYLWMMKLAHILDQDKQYRIHMGWYLICWIQMKNRQFQIWLEEHAVLQLPVTLEMVPFLQ